MKTLTLRQTEVLCSISDFVEEHGYPPTIRELADRFGISIKGAYDHIKALERKGQLRLGDNRSRAIEIIPQAPGDSRKSEVPLLGSVAAGRPLFADENFEGSVEVPKEMTRSGSCFALRVKGDSMKDAGIYDEDLAIIEERPTADNGEIVVAMIDDAVTLKRFYRENNRVKLVAENPAYSPIYTQDVRIIGRLRGIIRSY
ncbi:MAG TPA: transcriptional repressor LexA [Rectinemataceae bacterium]|nr:transcriptional repressor LexA [Rectinemataceae bacterium]